MAFGTVCSKHFHLTAFCAALPPLYRVILAYDALQLWVNISLCIRFGGLRWNLISVSSVREIACWYTSTYPRPHLAGPIKYTWTSGDHDMAALPLFPQVHNTFLLRVRCLILTFALIFTNDVQINTRRRCPSFCIWQRLGYCPISWGYHLRNEYCNEGNKARRWLGWYWEVTVNFSHWGSQLITDW